MQEMRTEGRGNVPLGWCAAVGKLSFESGQLLENLKDWTLLLCSKAIPVAEN